jgi:glycosyltransferase involved in cell wall biosynthesis
LPEYIEDGVTGLLVPPANAKLFADAIIRLLLDEVLRHRMGWHAKQWMEEENIRNAERTIEIYKMAINL